MQVLLKALSPVPKRHKTSQIELSDSEPELEEDREMTEAVEDDVPNWAKAQNDKMDKLLDMITEVKTSIGNIKDEIAQVRFQAGVAQAVAEEAIEKIDDVETRVFEKLEALESQIPSVVTIQKMIEETLSKMKQEVPKQHSPQMTKSNLLSHGSNEEKFSRTLVVGGFERDTPKREVVEFMNKSILKNVGGVDEAFAYNFGSVGFVRFLDRDDMFTFIKEFSTKDKPTFQGKAIWVTTSKTPDERTKSEHLSKFKKVLIETALADPSSIKIDYNRGDVFVNRTRIAEWKLFGNTTRVVADASKLKEVNINVEPEKIYDAVDELLQE